MTTPSRDYRRTQVIAPERLTAGWDAALHGVIGRQRRAQSVATRLREMAQRIHEKAEQYRNYSDHRLKEGLAAVRERVRLGHGDDDATIEESLALLVQAADRAVGLRPFPVQVMGALALQKGYLIEMATGEGKTLTASLAAVMAGWRGRPCHLLTVNDYLARRDADSYRPLYAYCGVSVRSVLAGMDPNERRSAYLADVVYTTSKELLADYLRDRIQLGDLNHPQRRLIRQLLRPHERIGEATVLRGIDTAIVDEADSVLIDEAVTPLIISVPRENPVLLEGTRAAHAVADAFEAGVDYKVDRKYREITITDQGYARLEQISAQLPGIWRGLARSEELIRQALTAREFYHLGQQYIIQEGKVVIVDEFTGRLMANRSWGHGLHQAVERKEGVELTDPTETLARLSFQRFFRLFRKLSGMTGTAHEAAGEFWHIYRLPVMKIPTNRPCIRVSYPQRIFPNIADKWQAIVEEILEVHRTGRPVLVGTRSVQASEELAGLLSQYELDFQLLNATQHAEEAHIVADAGQPGKITIATNMAGRGTDIRLVADVARMGGLHVIVSERHESGRIDRQLIGRCARQGDPGSYRVFISLEDELLKRFLPKPLLMPVAKAQGRGGAFAEVIANSAFDFAQSEAQRIAYRQRKSVLRMDTWLEEALAFSGSE